MALQRVMENINGAYGTSSKDQAALVTLQTAIGAVGSSPTNTYGSYKVLENGYITFTNGNEGTSAIATPVLKVTICSQSNPGYQLTQLFTVQVAH
jgi:hypothetical protein